MHILVVEDERALCETIVRSLRRLAYSVDFCYDGNKAIELLGVERYDLVLLDLNLPGADGMTVLRTLRQTDRDTKVLILSARSEVADKVEGLDAGANDYLAKPFHLEELEARIRSLTRRQFTQNDVVLTCGKLSFDTKTRIAGAAGQELLLTRKETGILEYLLLHRGRPVSQEELMDYFKTHVEKIILPVMEQYLPLKDMNRGEIAAFGSLVYNCGPGVLRGRNKMPTELSAAFARYKKDGREEDKNIVKKLINAKIYAKGRALPQLRYRRDLETRILFGDIVLDQAKADSLNNALDLSAVSIGGIYTIGHKNGGLPKDSTELVNRIANTPGQNLQDTLRQAFTPNVPKVIIRKKASRSGR